MRFSRAISILALLFGLQASSSGQQPVPHPPERPQPSQVARPPEPAQTSGAAHSSKDEQAETTFQVNVKLVNVFATVTDTHGAPIASLNKEDFQVFEDGKPQQIAVFDRESGLPLSIVVAIDASLSTRKDLPLELESARRFAHAIVRPIDGISIYQFSEFVNEVIPFTSDLRVIDRGISGIHSHSSTALYDAIYLGSKALIPRQGRKVMVVITDGGDTASKLSYSEAVRAAQTAEAIVYSIIMVPVEASAGRDIGGEHALIQISNDTGGKYYYASNLDGLAQAFQQISDELRTQYLIAYYPSARVGNDFRHIQVEVAPEAARKASASELHVRSRAGYYVSKLE